MLTLHGWASALGPWAAERCTLWVCVTVRPDPLVPKDSTELPPCLPRANHILQSEIGLVLGTTFPRRAGKALRLATTKVESALP